MEGVILSAKLLLLEHTHPCHPYGWYKWTPLNTLYYIILFNYLNHSLKFSKYSYHLFKTLKWVPLNITLSYIYILYFFHGGKKKSDILLLGNVILWLTADDVYALSFLKHCLETLVNKKK